MEQDAVKCPVLKWSAQAHCLEPQHEAPLSLSPGHCLALRLLAGRADSAWQKSQQVNCQARPEALGARTGGLWARGGGLRVLEGRLFSLLTKLGRGAEVLPLSEAQGGKFPGCVYVCV